MIQEINVVHPWIDRIDHEPFWSFHKGREALVAQGGEYFGRCDTKGLPTEKFFDDLEKYPKRALHHARSTFSLMADYLNKKNQKGHLSGFHAGNVSLSALAIAGADVRILNCIATAHPYRPAVEVREVTGPVSERKMQRIRKNVQGLSRAGVPILLDDIEDNGQVDLRWAPLFQHVAGIKLAGSMTRQILAGGLDSLSIPARQMVDEAVRDDRIIVLEQVRNFAEARRLSHEFNGFSRLLMQGYRLGGSFHDSRLPSGERAIQPTAAP